MTSVDIRAFKPDHPFAQKHVLYTAVSRVNLKMTAVGQAAALREQLGSDEIDRQRTALIRRFSLPSMTAQYARPHRWFLFFDPTVTEAVAEFVAELAGSDWIVPIFGETTSVCLAQVHAHIREHFSASEFPIVSTTRLDSDDALHLGFHAAVDQVIGKRELQPTPTLSLAVNLSTGAFLIPPRLHPVTLPDSFFALLEPLDHLTSSIIEDHSKLRKRARVEQVVTSGPAFLYVRHGVNISGAVSPERLRASLPEPAAIMPEFGLTADALLPVR